jgi:tetratricopeptide (TPR) repeat protein
MSLGVLTVLNQAQDKPPGVPTEDTTPGTDAREPGLVMSLPNSTTPSSEPQPAPELHLHVPPHGTPDEALSAIERGRVYLARGEIEQAESELSRATHLAPENAEAFLVRGQVYEHLGEDERAVADYTTAVQLDVSQLLTFAQRILAYTARRDFAGAVADADHSRLVNERLCRTCFLRSALHARRNEWARVIADCNQIIQLDPGNSVAFFRRGDANARSGEWSKAVADYTESLRLDPQSPDTFTHRGEALLHLGQTDQALADFTAALRLDPQHVSARTNRADAHMRRSEFDQAIIDYNQAIHLSPGAARPYAGRAVARLEKGEWERALTDLAKAQTLDPTTAHDPETQRTTERLRAGHEQVIAGLTQFKRLFRQTAEGIGIRPELRLPEHQPVVIETTSAEPPHALQAPLKEPTKPTNTHTRTTELARTAAPPRTQEAITTNTAGEQGLPEEDQSERQRRLAVRHCRQGQVAQKEGDQDRALAAYSAAIAVDPTCVEAYRERGLIHRLAHRLEEALDDFNTALELEQTAELYFRRGMTYTEQRHFKRAFADYDEAIRRDPNHAQAYLNRGSIAVIVGDFNRAAADAERALALDPSLVRARFLRGVAYGKQGRHDQAGGDFDLVLSQEPENARAHNHRGLAYAAEGKYEEAIAAYDEAIRLTPDLWAAYFNRGIAYHLKGDFDAAVAEFSHFIEHKPDYAQAYHYRGLSRQARGEYDEAIADFTEAFQLDPNLTEAYTSCIEATRIKYEAASRANETVSTAATTARTKPALKARPASEPEYPPLPPLPEPVQESTETDSDSVETRSLAVVAGTERTLLDATKLPARPTGKLRLECPECGTPGLLDLQHLGKKFRCPGCHLWWRTNAAGNLEETSRPEDVAPAADDAPKSGIWKPLPTTDSKSSPRSVAAGPANTTANADTTPETPKLPEDPTAERTPAKPTPAKPTPAKPNGTAPRRRQESSLRFAALWLAAFSRTRAALWVALVVLVLFAAAMPFLSPSLFPSELRSRGQKVAQAWLAKDTEQLKTFADPTLAESVPRWLETTPPPELNEELGKAAVTVSVERNDGSTAEILLQIKGTKPNGTPAYFVFRHRWANHNGTWYLQLDIPAVSIAPAGGAKKGDKKR